MYLVGWEEARGKAARFLAATLESGAAQRLTDPARVTGVQPQRAPVQHAAAAACAVRELLAARIAVLSSV